MGTLVSLSKSATLVWWYISVAAAFGFGVLFVVAWFSEEFARSEKWEARRKLLVTLAIVGVVGEQLSTLAEFAFSEHLQIIDDAKIATLQFEGLPRAVRFEQSKSLFECLQRAP